MDLQKYLGGDISVYVGTYGKYASGSTKGAWVNMEAVKDVDQFWRICRTIHKERDPEWMFQDYQGFPDWLYSESMGSEEIAEILRYAHATPEERAKIACEDVDDEEDEKPLSLAETLRLVLLAHMGGTETSEKPKAKPSKADDKVLLEEYMKEWEKVWPGDKRMLDYERKKWSGGVRLENGGIVAFEKPSMSTRFCFHDEGPQYDYYCELMADKETRLRDYFLHENLDGMDEEIRAMELNCRFPEGEYHSRYYCKQWYLMRESYSGETAPLNLWKFKALSVSQVEDNPKWYGDAVKMSDADRQTILAGLKREREKFEKRLQTYLKRYGVSKIHTWTYWADA